MDGEEREQLLGRVESDGSVRDAEVLSKRADGTVFWSLRSFFPIEYAGESARLGWIYDITERKRAEDQRFNVTLERTLDPAVGELDLYPAELMRVFLNLIGNAFYATRKRATAGDGSSYVPTVAVSTQRRNGAVEVHVRDNGTGVPKALTGW